VAAFTTLVSALVTSATGHLAVWASVAADVVPFIAGEGRFRLRVGGATVAGCDVSSTILGVDRVAALSACSDVPAGVPVLVELQWQSGPLVLLACEPVAEPDEEHATLIVAERP